MLHLHNIVHSFSFFNLPFNFADIFKFCAIFFVGSFKVFFTEKKTCTICYSWNFMFVFTSHLLPFYTNIYWVVLVKSSSPNVCPLPSQYRYIQQNFVLEFCVYLNSAFGLGGLRGILSTYFVDMLQALSTLITVSLTLLPLRWILICRKSPENKYFVTLV